MQIALDVTYVFRHLECTNAPRTAVADKGQVKITPNGIKVFYGMGYPKNKPDDRCTICLKLVPCPLPRPHR